MEKTSPSFKQALRIVIKRNVVRLSLLFILLAVWWVVMILRGEQRYSISPHTLAKVTLSRIDSPTRVVFYLNDPKDKKVVPTLMVALSSKGFSSAISQQCETRLSQLLEGQPTWVRSAYVDNDQQTVGRVLLARPNAQPDDIGLSLVREGCAYFCRKDASYLSSADQQEYASAEEYARVARQGIWMDASAKAPAECNK